MFLPAAGGGQACERKSDISNKTFASSGARHEGAAQTPVLHLQLPLASSLEGLYTAPCSSGRSPEVIDTTTPWP